MPSRTNRSVLSLVSFAATGVVALTLSAHADNLTFENTPFDTPFGPGCVKFSDLNADGIPDLVTCNVASDSVSVLLGNGDGTFQTHQDYATGFSPSAVAIEDFDADGSLDLAVSNAFSGSVSILRGNGDGTFQAREDTLIGSIPAYVAAGDLNGDTIPDLAVAKASFGSTVISVLFGHGDGTFLPPEDFVTGNFPRFVAINDVDHDGAPDLIATNGSGNDLAVLLGNGDGTFQPNQNYATGDIPVAVAFGDFNADGNTDLVVANSSSFFASVLLGNGDGTFQSSQNVSVGFDQNFVAIGDFDTDGIPDLVVAQGGFGVPEAIRLLLGQGDGTFKTNQTMLVGFDPNSIAVADLDGDNDDDLAVANQSSFFVNVLLNHGKPDDPKETCPPDTTGDGFIDLADLNLVLANFGEFTSTGDATNDGVVNLADLNAVLASFGTACD